jgi:hypothetical protein
MDIEKMISTLFEEGNRTENGCDLLWKKERDLDGKNNAIREIIMKHIRVSPPDVYYHDFLKFGYAVIQISEWQIGLDTWLRVSTAHYEDNTITFYHLFKRW